MKNYYVNRKKQPISGDNEVHTSDCTFMPSIENREYLGLFSNCKDAVKEATKTYPQSNGCKICSNSCHTS